MKITTISYSEVFPKEPYGVNKRYEYSAQLDDGEDDIAARKALVRKVKEWNLENKEPERLKLEVKTPTEFVRMVDNPASEINLQDEKKEISIDNASTLEELATLKRDLPPNLMPAYMKKLNELTRKLEKST